MGKLKFNTEIGGICSTPCPFGIVFYKGIVRVGSNFCTNDCEHCHEYHSKEKYIICNLSNRLDKIKTLLKK